MAEVMTRPLRSTTGWWTRARKRSAKVPASDGLGAAALEQVGTPARSAFQRLGLAPFMDFLMVAAAQHLGHPHPAKFFRACVLRILHDAVRKRILLGRIAIAKPTRHQ